MVKYPSYKMTLKLNPLLFSNRLYSCHCFLFHVNLLGWRFDIRFQHCADTNTRMQTVEIDPD